MTRRSLALASFSLVFLLSVSAGAAALSVGTKAPEIDLPDLQGTQVQLPALKGKVVLVDFWASWCAPCRDELPVLEALHHKYAAKGLVIVGVSADSERENMTKFLRRTKLSFRVVHDVDRKVAGRYAPPKMPTSYLIDRNGLVRHVHAGYKSGDAAALESEIKALLAQK